jgi:DHA2 family multidrug resistance protein
MAGRSHWVIAPVVALATFMEVLDISIANVALQHIAGSMSASVDESTWVLTSYLVTNAIVLPVSGWMSSVFGRKRFYLACILGFGASSLLCGMAPNLAMLILFRAIQGLTGGGLQPSSQAILADTFPPQQRGMALAFYGIAVVFAPAIGPAFGGWLTDNFSWRWVFLINVPISIVLFFLIGAMIEDPPHLVAERAERRKRGIDIDYFGFGLLAVGIGFLQVVLDKGQEDDWFSSGFIGASAAISLLALVSVVIWELSREDPIVDLGLLRNRNFAIANILMFMLGFVLLGSTTLLPQYVQELLGYTAVDAGLVISPGGFAMLVLMPVIGRMTGKVDARYMIAFGLAVCSLALYAMTSVDLTVDFWSLAIYRLFQSAGLGFLFIPINAVAYVGIPQAKNNNASALINLSRNLGGSVGISLASTVLARRTQFHVARLTDSISPYAQPYVAKVQSLQHQMMAQGGSAADALRHAQAIVAANLQQQAQLLSFLDDFLLLAVLFGALIPLAFLLRRRPAGAGPAPAAH